MKFIKKYKYYIILIAVLTISYTFMGNNLLKMNAQSVLTGSFSFDDTFMSMIMEAFLSIHMSVFVLGPLSSTAANPKEKFKKLFINRIIILIIGDIFISPMTTAIIDFMAVFVGAFIIVPVVLYKNNTFSSRHNNIELKNIYTDNDIKYKLSTVLATYLFALSENDKEEIKNITSKKMYDDSIKLITNYETYNKRNIIDDIDINKLDILFRYVNNNEEFIHANIRLNAYDYIEYNSMKNYNKKECYEYKVVFKKVIDINMQQVELDRCPSCSASIVNKNISQCEYCGSLLVEKKNEWLIEKLEKTLIK